jgi:hypothetical protein
MADFKGGVKPDMIATLLDERGRTHGQFNDTATVAQETKHIWHQLSGWGGLTPAQQEALDQIATKIARILCGDPRHAAEWHDNWHDIEGYCRLALRKEADL